MNILIRSTRNRIDFVKEYYTYFLKNYDIILDNGEYKKELSFVHALKSCTDNTLIIEDDQLFCDNFLDIAENIIKAHHNYIICLSQMDFNNGRQYKKSGYYKPYYNSISTFCTYYPKDMIDKIIAYYDYGFNTRGEYYDETLADILKILNIPAYYVVPSLSGHIKEFKSEMNHKLFTYSYGFPYKKAYERLHEITGKYIKDYIK